MVAVLRRHKNLFRVQVSYNPGKSLERLGVGFIGSGFIARFLAASWLRVRSAEISAIYNERSDSANSLAGYIEMLGMPKPKVYTDLHEMLSDKAVSAVWMVNPNFKRVETVKVVSEEASQGKNDIIGVCCEKPLARNAGEAEEILSMIEKSGLLHGYLENQVFAPSVTKGREVLWRHGGASTQRPFLARAAEEHGGPHSSWFWDPRLSGGGVLIDMSCHSIEAARYLLTDPSKPKTSLMPVAVQGLVKSLKWTKEPYRTTLYEKHGVDYAETPAEDYANTTVLYEDEEGESVLSEARTSWCYMGPGLRISMEALGPEYSISINSLDQELNVFLSRNIRIPASEEFLEKQTAEQGLMPIIADETFTYGYQEENRHMVESFLKGKMPRENWRDGLLVTQLMMTAYKSAEEGKTLQFNPEKVKDYIPKIAKGEWKTGA
jgi:predicted dehydrogenase